MPRLEAIVLDTHALVWYLEDRPELSSLANSLFSQVEQGKRRGLIPTIALAELQVLAEKGRTGAGLSQVVASLRESGRFQFVPFDLRVALQLEHLTGLELHDRILVATAQAYRASLVSNDRHLRASGLVPCLW